MKFLKDINANTFSQIFIHETKDFSRHNVPIKYYYL